MINKYECKLGAQIFGYIETKDIPYVIEKDKEYEIAKIEDDKRVKDYYYAIVEDNIIVTTISKEEFELFFRN